MSKVWKIYYTEQKEEIIQADDYEEMFEIMNNLHPGFSLDYEEMFEIMNNLHPGFSLLPHKIQLEYDFDKEDTDVSR